MKTRDLIMLGAGGHEAVVAECAMRAGWRVVAIASREEPTSLRSIAGLQEVEWIGDPDAADVFTRIERIVRAGAALHAAVGDAATRARWFERFGGVALFATVIDPTAVVSTSAVVESGAFLSTGAVVHARARIGEGVIVNTRAVVEHDAVVGAFAHISPGAIVCGAVRVGAEAQIGAGAVVIPERTVCAKSIIGAGSVVVRDIPDGVVAVGVPARPRSRE